MNERDVFESLMMINEASMVRLGVKVTRQFTDEELVPAFGALFAAEAELSDPATLGSVAGETP